MKRNTTKGAFLALALGLAAGAAGQEVPGTEKNTSAVARPGADWALPADIRAPERTRATPRRHTPLWRLPHQGPSSRPAGPRIRADGDRPAMPIPIPGVGARPRINA